MQIAIVGSREFDDYEWFKIKVLESIEKWNDGKPITIISGGDKGVDSLAERFAKENRYKMQIFYPEWDQYGRAAGPKRNDLIINACTHIIAFPSRTGRGTQDSIRKAQSCYKECDIYWVD